MIIKTQAYPRVGLIGNPSDGYFGKTIAFTFKDFCAEIELWESPELELLPSRRDHSVFPSMCDLHEDVKRHGYYGGFRLLKASCKCFLDYCNDRGIILDRRNFTMRYRSNIPGRVGLAGSSAIITACMRALMGFYNVEITRHTLANLVLSVENTELAIPAGLQDRVAQAYQGLTYMDFDQKFMDERSYGNYKSLDIEKLPPCYIAYREDLAEGTEVYHNDLRARYKRKNPEVLQAIQRWAELAEELKELLQRSEVGDRKTEVGSRKTEVGSRRTEVACPKDAPAARGGQEPIQNQLSPSSTSALEHSSTSSLPPSSTSALSHSSTSELLPSSTFALQEMHNLINENFNLRASLYDVGDGNREMVETARACGASAKFAGSGGAIVGFLKDEDTFAKLQAAFKPKGIVVLKPAIV